MIRKSILAILGAVLGVGLLSIAPGARADATNQATRLVLNQAVRIPGNTILPAGTYWLIVDNGPSDTSDLVRIYSADKSILYAALETIPVQRAEISRHTELVLAQQPQGKPLALLRWFYPDRLVGHEFVYSPSREANLMANERIDVFAKVVS